MRVNYIKKPLSITNISQYSKIVIKIHNFIENKTKFKQKLTRIWQIFQSQRMEDSRLLPYMISIFILITFAAIVVGVLAGGFRMYIMPIIGLILSTLSSLMIFNQRTKKSMYIKAEGQTGAAAWVLNSFKGRWYTTAAVVTSSHFDVVHRVVGKPGIIFIGEGAANRVKLLLAQEKKRTARIISDIPIYSILIGNQNTIGEIPLSKLKRYLLKLPKNITNKQIDFIESRLTALNSKNKMLKKGPIPTGFKMRNIQRTTRTKRN